MRLQSAVVIDRDIIPNVDQIEFCQLGRVQVDASTDLGTQQTKEPADKRRARQKVQKEWRGETVQQGRNCFRPPDERTPQGSLTRSVASHQNPLESHHRQCGRQSRFEIQEREDRHDDPCTDLAMHDEYSREQNVGNNNEERRRERDSEEFNEEPLCD